MIQSPSTPMVPPSLTCCPSSPLCSTCSASSPVSPWTTSATSTGILTSRRFVLFPFLTQWSACLLWDWRLVLEWPFPYWHVAGVSRPPAAGQSNKLSSFLVDPELGPVKEEHCVILVVFGALLINKHTPDLLILMKCPRLYATVTSTST